jgi:peptide/nickel transport system substrate-binding protein
MVGSDLTVADPMEPMTRSSLVRRVVATAALVALIACGVERPVEPRADDVRGEARRGGRLVAALTAEPATFNPLVMVDSASRTVIDQLMADLVHIDRQTHATFANAAESWTVSDDGRTLTAVLRPGLTFSDGEPCTADDVVFSFECYLDEEVGSPQRDLLIVGGEPIEVRATDERTVVIDMAAPYAVADRLFDGFAVLPEHVLGPAREAGTLAEQWGTATPPDEIVGLGAFRLGEVVPGERVVLERNPHYWRTDDDGVQLPYLDELVFVIVPDAETAALRFEAGELDVIDRLAPETFEALASSPRADTAELLDLGPGLDFTFLFFNLNDLGPDAPERLQVAQSWFREVEFRRAVSTAIDRQAIVDLVYRGRATPLATHVTPGYGDWMHPDLEPPAHDPAAALERLESVGFSRDSDGPLLDPDGRPVEFSILVSAGSTARERMATIIQADLATIGINAGIATAESRTLVARILQQRDYEASILGFGGTDVDPNPAIGFLASTGPNRLWRLQWSQAEPAWQMQIDTLLREQLIAPRRSDRIALYHRVQEVVFEHHPLTPLTSQHLLVGVDTRFVNVRPGLLDHHLLWNAASISTAAETTR